MNGTLSQIRGNKYAVTGITYEVDKISFSTIIKIYFFNILRTFRFIINIIKQLLKFLLCLQSELDSSVKNFLKFQLQIFHN